jgi:uncharacterized protein
MLKIDAQRIPPEGLSLEGEIDPRELDLETEVVRFKRPIKIKADVSKITNVVNVDSALEGLLQMNCSRCLIEFEADFRKSLRFTYPVNKLEPVIDLGQDIREEIILDYPVKPLCSPSCKGLCPKCGKNLNEGVCNC